MHRFLFALAATLGLSFGTAQAQEADILGGHDHPLVTRMPGYYLSSYDEKDFDVVESPYLSGVDAKWEGKAYRLGYSIKASSKPISMAQIARNYEAALKKIGGKVMASDGRMLIVKLPKGATTWIEVQAYNDGTSYSLLIVESKAMEQEVVADAAALKAGIAADGKIAVYGIYFDTGKAVVKPESAPTLEQIVKLLKDSPKLNLYVVGHTDGTGTADANLRLSNDRAMAVVQALIARSIGATRLKAAGAGPYCPVATNRDEAGKARNRRVELVEKL